MPHAIPEPIAAETAKKIVGILPNPANALTQFVTPISQSIAEALGISPNLVQPLLLLLAKVLLAVLLLAATWIVASWVKRTLERIFERTEIDKTLEHFCANAARWVTLVIGIIICLEAFGFSATGLVVLLSTAGIAIGLALQGSLSHFASGIMLLIFRPFKIADFVTAAGREGTVADIDLFTTTIDTTDNRRIIIPNGQIFGTVIENHSFHNRRLATIRLTLAASADPDAIRADLLAAAHSAIAASPAAIKDPPPTATLVDLPGNQVWALSVWCRRGQVDTMKEALWLAARDALSKTDHAVQPPVQLIKQVT